MYIDNNHMLTLMYYLELTNDLCLSWESHCLPNWRIVLASFMTCHPIS